MECSPFCSYGHTDVNEYCGPGGVPVTRDVYDLQYVWPKYAAVVSRENASLPAGDDGSTPSRRSKWF